MKKLILICVCFLQLIFASEKTLEISEIPFLETQSNLENKYKGIVFKKDVNNKQTIEACSYFDKKQDNFINFYNEKVEYSYCLSYSRLISVVMNISTKESLEKIINKLKKESDSYIEKNQNIILFEKKLSTHKNILIVMDKEKLKMSIMDKDSIRILKSFQL